MSDRVNYSWLQYRNIWTDEPIESYENYSDEILDGWYIAFGEQMLSELNDLLIKYNYVDDYRIIQVKEKFGSLRWYDNGFPREGEDEYDAWSRKYEQLSMETCIVCGAPGKMRVDGWMSPYCEEHK